MTPNESFSFRPKKILCAVDMAPMSVNVLNWARHFAEAYKAKLQILHADYSEYPPYFLPSQAQELAVQTQHRRAELNRRVTELVRDTLGASPLPEIAIVEGHPAEAILGRIASAKPDLAVIGSHGHSGFSRLQLGSVAERLIRTSTIPTLVARTRTECHAPKIERVLCPVNIESTAHESLRVAAEVAGAFRAQLTVVHAVEESHIDLGARHRELCAWVPADVRKQCSIVESVRRGNPAEQILLAAREQSADLIVLGAERRPFLDLAIMGATAERLVRHAEAAVLVLPSKQEASV